MRVKRRRLDWECHLKKDDPVIFRSGGFNYIGKVYTTKLRQFGDTYNRVIVLVEPNYVSSSQFSHLYRNHIQYEQFYLTPITNSAGKLTTDPSEAVNVYKLDPNSDIGKWRQNLAINQEVWFRSGYENRRRLRCVVVDVQSDTISIQPKYSKVIKTVKKKSEQIQPVLINNGSRNECILSFDLNYVVQTSMCASMDRKDKYLGCWCQLKDRDYTNISQNGGYIIDVDYGVADGKNLYCYVEDSGASEYVPHLRFNSHMTYVNWVTDDDIIMVNEPNNKLSVRDDVELEEDTITINYKHNFLYSDLNSLMSLKENDLELMFYYILRHAKSSNDSKTLFAIAYQLWSNHAYLIRPLYSQYKDSYNLDGLKRILLAKQDYFSKTNNMVQLLQVQHRLNVLLSSHSRQHMVHILEAEESYRNIPTFKFTPVSINVVGAERQYLNIRVKIAINNVHTLDVVAYAGTSISYNNVATRPIMTNLLRKYQNLNVVDDVFRISRYGKLNVKKFKEDKTPYTQLNKISTLKRYQSWMVNRMVKEEASLEPLSNIFTAKITDDLQYNFVAGFQAYDYTASNGGILCLNVGWGKTVIILELLLRQGGSTLICAPLSLMDQWKREVEHFAPSLSVCEYYGRERKQDANIVLTTYSTLRQVVDELKTFDRVVFDESHLIKNSATQRATACLKVKARNRWCVSATPYNDNNQQFQTQLRMLKIKPFQMNVPILQNDPIFAPLFERIFFSFHERGLKKMGIQPIKKKVKDTRIITVDADEDLQLLLGGIRSNIGNGPKTLAKLRLPVIRTQIACTIPSTLPLSAYAKKCENDNQEITRDQLVQSLENRTNISSEYKKSFMEKLTSENSGTCCICLCEYDQPTITPCLHVYCNTCIKESLKRSSRCPQCRQNVTAGQLKKMVTSHMNEECIDNIHYFTDVIGNSWSVPVDVKKAYEAVKNKVPKKFECIRDILSKTNKSCVIFSQYEMPLKLLKTFLDCCEITNGLISGKTSRKKRGQMIKDFSEGEMKVFLLTTKTAAVGINLQKGSTIIYLEPIIDIGEQIQCIGRLHRIGQEEDIDVIQLSTKGTYEQDMENQLRVYKESQRRINRVYKGREKRMRQSQVKYQMYDYILSD